LEEKSDFVNPKEILQGNLVHALRWKVCFLLRECGQKIMRLTSNQEALSAWNNTQVFYLQEAAKAHCELQFVEKAIEILRKKVQDPPTIAVIWKMIDIYCLHSITKNLSTFLEGGYFNPQQCNALKEELLTTLNDFSNDSIAVIDSVAIPDIFMPSAFGMSDGNIYKNLWRDLRASKGCTERAQYWKVLRKPVIYDQRPKL